MPFPLFVLYEREILVHRATERVGFIQAIALGRGGSRTESGDWSEPMRAELETARMIPPRGSA